ncbi:MAG: hypothetical protein AcusKO_36320 [Acuticoccus sp.]
MVSGAQRRRAGSGGRPAAALHRFGLARGAAAAHPVRRRALYEERYGVGAESGENPLLHYLTEGWRLGHEPHRLFKTTWYLCQNPDVAAADREPLCHYLAEGWKENRRPHPAFDPEWYLETHRDVGLQRPEPLAHYLKNGWQEGRAPIERCSSASGASGRRRCWKTG